MSSELKELPQSDQKKISPLGIQKNTEQKKKRYPKNWNPGKEKSSRTMKFKYHILKQKY
jgi:hypothetical protein